MLYSEFVEGTGCKVNDHNYKVYRDLEVMYMNSNMSKAEIYEYGKKLVDNSKSEEELRVEREINEEIEEYKAEIKKYNEFIKDNERLAEYWKRLGDKEMIAFYRNPIKYWKQEIKHCRNKIAELNWILGK